MAKKDITSKKNKNGVPFSRAYSRFFLGLCRFLRPFLHGKCKQSEAFRRQKKEGPMLVVCNHLSAYDFIHFSAAMYGAPLNFVVAENMMYSMPIFAKLISGYHAITKKQYFADIHCIMNIKKYLDAGVSVLICPEGKVAADGVTGAIMPSIARLVQWLGYPVGVVKMKGASLARPKWAYNLRFIRKGNVYSECDMLLSAKEAKELKKDEILEKITDALAHNEHKWQIENGVRFVGKRYAEGLERLLYYCPKCGAEFENRTHGDRMVCNKCGNEVRYSFDGKIEPVGDGVSLERIDLWYAKERELVREEVQKDDFCLCDKVNLFVENEKSNGYRFACEGTLRLDRQSLRFDSEQTQRPANVKAKFGVNSMTYDAGENAVSEPVEEELRHLSFAINRCDTVANLPGTAIDMYDDKHVYRFMFADRNASTKYVLAIEQAFVLGKNQ
ncbi:MAG: 1-acyl-sn-glycerol-3-phosphate acyltransferase [Christensenellales bacterium]